MEVWIVALIVSTTASLTWAIAQHRLWMAETARLNEERAQMVSEVQTAAATLQEAQTNVVNGLAEQKKTIETLRNELAALKLSRGGR